MRRALGLSGAACLLVLGAMPAQAAQQPGEQALLAAHAEALPPQLKQALRRDLGLDPVTYLANGRAARQAAAAADRLRAELGSAFGGAWFESGNRRLRVAVTDEAAADRVRIAGAGAQVRPVNAEALDQAVDAVARWSATLPPAERAAVYGITPDVRAGNLRLLLADSPIGRRLANSLPRPGVSLRVEHTDLPPQPPAVRAQGCGYGLNALDRLGRAVSLGPAHCAPLGSVDKFTLASLDGDGPGDDLASIRIADPHATPLPEVAGPGGAQRVESLAAAIPGAQVCAAGRAGYSCGTVFAPRSVWRLGESGGMALRGFEVHGLCVDGGGALLAGGAALGWTSAAHLGSAAGRCRPAPGPSGLTTLALGESLTADVLPSFGGELRLLTTEGDADADGVRDVDELAPDRTRPRDANRDKLVAYLDPDEPRLRAPTLLGPLDGSRGTEALPEVHGTARPGARVSVRLDAKPPVLIIADGEGRWRLTLPEKLCLGGHQVALKQSVDGQESPETVGNFTVMPPPPVITTPGQGDHGDLPRPQIAGTGKPKALVTVSVDGVPAGSTMVGADGQWRLRPGADLKPGARSITARQTVTRVDSAEASVRYLVGGAAPPSRDAVETGANPGLAAELKGGGHPVAVAVTLGGGLLLLGLVLGLRRFRRRAGAD
ncbi:MULTISPECIES: hypothetical protein [unclassified Crossiella]|uniref:hypothetical protein n=1 Tax=unclassified Crossiella TaxID=2620835 RepID=UPI001FFE6E32|nr:MULTISPECIES: hypothetical protein [unclassified Crossiella]MCK2236436.1 hypothetical protein [Crossiella sp. S99.2]MCK2250103.1 hypothetical protein [Crossiella sp. S99.1]